MEKGKQTPGGARWPWNCSFVWIFYYHYKLCRRWWYYSDMCANYVGVLHVCFMTCGLKRQRPIAKKITLAYTEACWWLLRTILLKARYNERRCRWTHFLRAKFSKIFLALFANIAYRNDPYCTDVFASWSDFTSGARWTYSTANAHRRCSVECVKITLKIMQWQTYRIIYIIHHWIDGFSFDPYFVIRLFRFKQGVHSPFGVYEPINESHFPWTVSAEDNSVVWYDLTNPCHLHRRR